MTATLRLALTYNHHIILGIRNRLHHCKLRGNLIVTRYFHKIIKYPVGALSCKDLSPAQSQLVPIFCDCMYVLY